MSNYTIPVLKNAIAVMRAVATGRNTTTKALALNLGIPASTTYRILQTLTTENWVRPIGGGEYQLSLGLLPLLQPLVRHELLIETVRDPLLRLSRETGLTTKLSVRQGDHAITIFRAESPRPTSVGVKIGASFHLTLGSSGTVLLSDLPEPERARIIAQAPEECWQSQPPADLAQRQRDLAATGTCLDLGGYCPNQCAVSAALVNRESQVVGAITAIGFADDFAGQRADALRRQLLFAAGGCNRLIHGFDTTELASA